MPRMPRVSGTDVHRALKRAGWYDHEQEGSHVQMRHPEKPRKVTIPIHRGKILPPKTLASILDQAGITVDEFREKL